MLGRFHLYSAAVIVEKKVVMRLSVNVGEEKHLRFVCLVLLLMLKVVESEVEVLMLEMVLWTMMRKCLLIWK